jgi:hypothetical protein
MMDRGAGQPAASQGSVGELAFRIVRGASLLLPLGIRHGWGMGPAAQCLVRRPPRRLQPLIGRLRSRCGLRLLDGGTSHELLLLTIFELEIGLELRDLMMLTVMISRGEATKCNLAASRGVVIRQSVCALHRRT